MHFNFFSSKSISKESMSVTEAGKKEGLTKEYFENILKSSFNEHFISYFENEVRKGSDKIRNKQKRKYIELKAGGACGELIIIFDEKQVVARALCNPCHFPCFY